MKSDYQIETRSSTLANKADVELGIVLDRSSSMIGCAMDTLRAFNNLLAEQRRLNAAATKVSLMLFNERTEVVFDGNDLDSVGDLDLGTFQPEGGTALWDGLGKMIELIGGRYDAKPAERRSRVLIVTLTDGEENRSQQYTLAQLRELVGYRQKVCGWQFITISPQAISLALRLGVPIGNAGRWGAEPQKIRLLLDRVSRSISTYRLGGTARLQLT